MKALHDVALGLGYLFLAVTAITVAGVVYVAMCAHASARRRRRLERGGQVLLFPTMRGGAPPSHPRRRAHR